MFNKDFYPTPNTVIDQMLMGVDFQNKVILEPSAGKGNIVDYLKANGAKEVLACELNKDLAKIVSSKCRLIGSDFLELHSSDVSHIDMIVMNPPFSDEERHILHAWEIAPDGCTIISLCNASIFRGYTTKQTEISDLIRLNGRKEEFGRCFSDSERETDVYVGCIWLYKPKGGDDEFSDFFSMDEEPEALESGLVKYNFIRDLVGRYVDACKMFNDVMEVSNKINAIVAPIVRYGIKFGAYKDGRDNNYTQITYDVYKKELQKQCWNRVFEEMNMNKYMSKGVRDKINKFVEIQIHVPFTMKNIFKMLEVIVGTHGNRMGQVMIEAFDMICSFSADNSTAGEKWRTNSNYMVNRKFIVPWITQVDYDGCLEINYSNTREQIDDLIRALCLLTGTNYDTIPSLYHFALNTISLKDTYEERNNWRKMEFGRWYEWAFFRIKGFKKGTMHFEFIDEKVWMNFNIEVAKARGCSLPQTSNSTKKARKKGTEIEVYL